MRMRLCQDRKTGNFCVTLTRSQDRGDRINAGENQHSTDARGGGVRRNRFALQVKLALTATHKPRSPLPGEKSLYSIHINLNLGGPRHLLRFRADGVPRVPASNSSGWGVERSWQVSRMVHETCSRINTSGSCNRLTGRLVPAVHSCRTDLQTRGTGWASSFSFGTKSQNMNDLSRALPSRGALQTDSTSESYCTNTTWSSDHHYAICLPAQVHQTTTVDVTTTPILAVHAKGSWPHSQAAHQAGLPDHRKREKALRTSPGISVIPYLHPFIMHFTNASGTCCPLAARSGRESDYPHLLDAFQCACLPHHPTSFHFNADCGRYPSGVIVMVDAFTSGTNKQRKRILREIQECPAARGYFVHRETSRQLAQAMALTTLPCRALSVMIIAHRLGCHFKSNHFESVAYHLSLREHWSSVPLLVSLARHHCGRATARLLNWKMRALIECRRFDQLDYIMTEFIRDNIKPIRRTFHLLLSAHLRNQDLDAAKRVIQMMENAGFSADASTHALICTVYRSLGLDTQVHARALDALHSIDSRMATRVLNSIVQHFLDVGDELGAAQYIEYFGLTGVDVSSPLGNNITKVVGASLPTRHPTCPTNIVRVTPDAATFTMLIDYLASKRHFTQVRNLLTRLAEADVKPDSGVPPIDARDVPLAVHAFNAILGRAMELRGLSGARFIFRAMRARGITPSSTTIEIFLDYLDRTENATPHQLIRVLRSMSTTISGLTLRHLHIILRSILRREKYLFHGSGCNATASRFSPLRESTSALPQGRILLDGDTFNIDDGTKSCRQFTYDSSLRPIVLSLSRRAIRGDRATIAMRLRHESMVDPSLDTARDVLRHMVDQGMHPNQYHYVALMDGYAKCGNMRVAEHIMRAARGAGFKPEVVMYTVLITGYGRQGQTVSARVTECHAEAVGNGLSRASWRSGVSKAASN
ncbi:hypothetical protein EV401DRAFT_2193390 [Pisolithus croceorrhizus]|nr:hypothetical protein EV401DRAFT_2193390 [Pisolithus croceorrhizus]